MEAEWLRVRGLLQLLLPPVVYRSLRLLRNRAEGRRPQWEYVPEGWARALADPEVRGWNVAGVAERHRLLWPAWTRALEGNGTLGLDFTRSLRPDAAGRSVPTELGWAHNAVMAYAYVLALAAVERRDLSVLDWGGGVGQFASLSAALLPGFELDYHVKDVPALCELGRELNPSVTFHEDDSWRERTYDLVLASSALQYAEDWRSVLAGLTAVADDRVFVTRVPIVSRSPYFVVLQRAEAYGFETQFLGWFLNRAELLGCAEEAGLALRREFVLMDETPAAGAPEQARYRGFFFQRA
jgi:putative methyltransferase (TIGR04325 family)